MVQTGDHLRGSRNGFQIVQTGLEETFLQALAVAVLPLEFRLLGGILLAASLDFLGCQEHALGVRQFKGVGRFQHGAG